MSEVVYSLCFVCSVRCPIKVTAEHGQVSWIEGSPQVPGMEGSPCPRGVAGNALLNDTERLQTPLIRTGARGAGEWRKATWDEALDFVADRLKAILDKFELIVAIDLNFSDIAWYADVVLPESLYLERMDCVQQVNGLKPQLFLRSQAVAPRYDTLPSAIILKQLAERLGVGRYFPYETMEELVRWQLEGTGFTLEDLAARGVASCTDQRIFWERKQGIKFKTPPGKIEIVSSLLENAGFPSLPPYEPVSAPAVGQFRLTVGRCAVHTHVSTQNNPYLAELVPENLLWINSAQAAGLGISNGMRVAVSSPQGSGFIRALVTDHIHPEAVFMLHGFGHEAQQASRCFEKGLSDSLLQANISDKIGGSPALHDTFVTVRAA